MYELCIATYCVYICKWYHLNATSHMYACRYVHVGEK